MATAAAAQAEGPAPPPPRHAGEAPAQVEPDAMPEKRAPAQQEEDEEDGDEGEERRPERKRRRARVAALESVPRAAKVAAAVAAAAAAGMARIDDGSAGGACDAEGFTFHARCFSGIQTTPKFGSFNPGAIEFVAFHPRQHSGTAATDGTPVAGGDEETETAEGSDGNSVNSR